MLTVAFGKRSGVKLFIYTAVNLNISQAVYTIVTISVKLLSYIVECNDRTYLYTVGLTVNENNYIDTRANYISILRVTCQINMVTSQSHPHTVKVDTSACL